MKQPKTTYSQVSKLANVSPATVSRVARGNPSVAPELRDRIRAAAAQLGIDLDEKRNEKARTIVFLLANRDILNSFHARILLGAESYCTAQNWELLFMSFRYSGTTPASDLHLPQIIRTASSLRAVILGGTNYPNLLHSLRQLGMPFSVLGNNVVGDWDATQFDTVYSDDIQGARDITAKLIADGHRHIWFIGDETLPWYARCASGYRDAMLKAGYEPRVSEIHSDDRELGYLATRSILAQHPEVTAFFAGADQIAGGVYEALRQAGLQIPNDISVVAFNDTDSRLLHPLATTVREFPEELGKHLAEFVIRRTRTPAMPPQSLTLPTQIVPRESTRLLLQSTAR